MMQRSDLILIGGGLGLAALAYVFAGELPAAVVGLAVVAGVVGGSLLPASGRTPAKATARKVRRTSAAARTTSVSVLPARGAAPRLALEPARAAAPSALPELRLTGDILHGMHTGGKTTRGLCSACGATLWLSARRPLKATCPVCGHTRVLEK